MKAVHFYIFKNTFLRDVPTSRTLGNYFGQWTLRQKPVSGHGRQNTPYIAFKVGSIGVTTED